MSSHAEHCQRSDLVGVVVSMADGEQWRGRVIAEDDQPFNPSCDDRRGLDPYEVLGIPHNASPVEIIEAYRRQSELYRSKRIATLDVRPEVKRYASLQRSRIDAAFAMLSGSIKAA